MKVANSPNFNDRSGSEIKYLIMHYTGMASGQEALERLRDVDAELSAHYLIEENGEIYSLVPEEKRAWHAGVSKWEDDEDINDLSVGIELVNAGHPYPGYDSEYTEFPEAQMLSLIELSKEIIERHQIKPWHVLGHSDIAWRRKIDPGELFDWQRLAVEGIGVYAVIPQKRDDTVSLDKSVFLENLSRYGYDRAEAEDETIGVVEAFQRHFRPNNICGEIDEEIFLLLEKLLESKFS